MGGKKCYKEILKINPKAKVLIVSGYSANGPGKEAIEAGAKGFVGKPFDVSHLLETIREILDEDSEMSDVQGFRCQISGVSKSKN